MGFAALEQRCNSAIQSKLSNKKVLIDSVEVDAIFNDGYAQALGGIGFESSEPSINCDDADVVDVKQGDLIVIGAVNYKVAEIHPDGTGRTHLRLKK